KAGIDARDNPRPHVVERRREPGEQVVRNLEVRTSRSTCTSTRALLGVLLLCCSNERLGAQAMRYEGTVTNHGYATRPTIDGTIGSLSWDAIVGDSTSGTLSIGSPLGGSGAAVYLAWADTVVLGSVSTDGDTILWLGTIAGDDLSG